MLALTPDPLETAAERAFFAELARWDTGSGVRAAVVASLPRTDGPLQRRLSDAVLFVPEGVVVVRVVEVRGSGVVTASPDGAWTIGPAGGPGEVLQLAGGGSSPLDGLMRAGMETAVGLRQAGLEPGRIGRLTVLVGDVSGLDPADGDLGEGDQVAVLDQRSLLLGIARASRYTGADDPRLWSTADLRAALEALQLPGRGPTVEELNGEGFPYSPYVLRTRELMVPAAVTAAPAQRGAAVVPAVPVLAVAAPLAAPPRPPAPLPAPAPPPAALLAPTPPPAALPAPTRPPAVPPPAAPAAAAPIALVPVPRPDPGAARPEDTVAVDGPPALSMEDTDGIGGLFANAEPVGRTAVLVAQPQSPRTAVLPVAPATDGDWAAFADAFPYEEDGEDDEADGGTGDVDRRRSRRLAVVAFALVVLVLVGGGGLLLLGGDPDPAVAGRAPAAADTTAGLATAGPAVGDEQVIDGVAYRVEAVRVDSSCAAHSYGEVAAFFAGTDCTGLSRVLYSTRAGSRPVVVSVSVVRMADAATARNLRALTDRDGSGNVSDLLREGVRYPGGPDRLSDAEYASAVSGSEVTVVESAWADSAAVADPAAVDLVAETGLVLGTPPFGAP